jgi:hypothetical protein
MNKNNLRAILIAFVLGLTFNQSIYAQSNNCELFQKALIYLNEESAKIKYTYQGPVDPLGGSIGKKVKVDGKLQYNFYIVDTFWTLDPLINGSWFAEIFKYPGLKNKTFVRGENQIDSCRFDNSMKFRICSYDKATELIEGDPFIEKHGSETVYFSHARIHFSNIIYSGPKLAVLSLKIKNGGNSEGNVRKYNFLFIKTGKSWKIKKVYSNFNH